jgi:hypothetical protein
MTGQEDTDNPGMVRKEVRSVLGTRAGAAVVGWASLSSKAQGHKTPAHDMSVQ